MRKSILTDDLTVSYLSGRPAECIHHVFGGNGRRHISEKYGFIIPLTNDEHNMSNTGIHFNKELDLMIKKLCQKKYEETHSRAEFMALIGRNYL
jgi:hypothetical protein